LHQQQNHPEIAKREYELTLKYSADPTEIVQAHGNLGFLLMGLNDPQKAEQEFSAALDLNPDKQNSLLGRGIVEYRQGNLNAAVNDLSRAARIAPLAQADFWLGRALQDQGQSQAALTAYEAALQLAPGMAEATQRRDSLRAAH
jgi:tetratricopeptide (TPR) repeat protein